MSTMENTNTFIKPIMKACKLCSSYNAETYPYNSIRCMKCNAILKHTVEYIESYRVPKTDTVYKPPEQLRCRKCNGTGKINGSLIDNCPHCRIKE